MDVVIPAHNEEGRVGKVVSAVVQAGYWPIVVADACTDRTKEAAEQAQAFVVEINEADKGSALAMGLARVYSEFVLFLDADLQGLTPEHVAALAQLPPLDGQVVGLLDTPWAQPTGFLPPISGQRRLPTAFAKSLPLRGSGWQAELLIDAAVGRARMPHRHVVLKGVTGTPKAKGEWLNEAGDLIAASGAHLSGLVDYIRS